MAPFAGTFTAPAKHRGFFHSQEPPMQRGIGRLRAGGNWSPGRLFADGSTGFWLAPDDLSTLYQDSAGTTAAVLTQPVGKAVDKAGGSVSVIQATAGSRPSLQNSAYYGIRADGVDDALGSTTGGGGTTGFLLCAAITVSGGAGTARCIFGDESVNGGYVVRVSAGNVLQFLAGDGGGVFSSASTAASLPVGETHVVMAWDDGANLNVQIDNGTVAQTARPSVGAGAAATSIFSRLGAQFFVGDCHQLVYVKNTAKTANDRTFLKRYVGAEVGLAT